MSERWERYAAGTAADHFGWWCETHLVQSVDAFAGKPLVLERWQRELMGEALAVDDAGQPIWSSVVLVVARKNGKTQLLAAYALYRLLCDEGQPEILLSAASDRQAGRLFDAVVAYIRQNPLLAALVHVRDYVGEVSRVDGGGKMLRMASDPATLHGYSPSLVVCDELHAWSKPSQRKGWAALTSGGGARTAPQTFTITTAGDASERETGILGRLVDGNEARGELERDPGLTISRNLAARTLVYNYSAPTSDPHDTAAMKLANPASWITEAYLRRQAENPELADGEVLQLHGCVWAESVAAWFPAAAWEACRDPNVEIPAGATVCVGVDAALTHDTTAVAVAWLRDDGKVVVETHVWAARPGPAAHELVPGGRMDFERIEEHIRQLARTYNVLEVAFDERYFTRSADLLADEPFVIFPFPQASALMADAYARWYAAVLDQRVVHNGDPVLAAHVMATTAQQTDRGWKVSKIRQTGKIDAHVASVLAHARAAGVPSVYDGTRGLLAV